jgi:hypothetical protein
MDNNKLSEITNSQYLPANNNDNNTVKDKKYIIDSKQQGNNDSKKLENHEIKISQLKQEQLSSIISKLIKNCQLAKLTPPKQVTVEDINKDHYWYSNDFDNIGGSASKLQYTDFLTHLATAKTSTNNNLKVAFLVGESSILSSVPELAQNCDLIIIVDFDIFLLKHIDLMIDSFASCSSEADEDEYFKNLHQTTTDVMSIPDRINVTTNDLQRTHKNAKEGLKEFYAFSSEERFQQVKHALSTTPVVTIKMDLFDQESMKSLADILKQEQAEITAVNLTNALEYTEPFFNSFDYQGNQSINSIHANIKNLPINENATCFSSNLLVHNRKSTVSTPDQLWQNTDNSIYQRIIELHPNKSWLEIFENACIEYAKETDINSNYDKLIYTLLMLKNKENINELQLNHDEILTIVANKLPENKQGHVLSWINSVFTTAAD